MQAENDARRAKAAADQAAAAAAAASRSLKIGEKQLGGTKDGEVSSRYFKGYWGVSKGGQGVGRTVRALLLGESGRRVNVVG